MNASTPKRRAETTTTQMTKTATFIVSVKSRPSEQPTRVPKTPRNTNCIRSVLESMGALLVHPDRCQPRPILKGYSPTTQLTVPKRSKVIASAGATVSAMPGPKPSPWASGFKKRRWLVNPGAELSARPIKGITAICQINPSMICSHNIAKKLATRVILIQIPH